MWAVLLRLGRRGMCLGRDGLPAESRQVLMAEKKQGKSLDEFKWYTADVI